MIDPDGMAVRRKRWKHLDDRPIQIVRMQGLCAYVEFREGRYATCYKIWLDHPDDLLRISKIGDVDLADEMTAEPDDDPQTS